MSSRGFGVSDTFCYNDSLSPCPVFWPWNNCKKKTWSLEIRVNQAQFGIFIISKLSLRNSKMQKFVIILILVSVAFSVGLSSDPARNVRYTTWPSQIQREMFDTQRGLVRSSEKCSIHNVA
ncbi:hypothetical protein RRG08_050335 [Elysia crispata]|uniref:Uncharacterized protein n=1 Tax=Elysia crispata TaxID=231223 RepID=A0AAE0ZYM5_9GAST|nr:hypothetical protein RRG08_050335 [Elysia crispata]